jgi:tether containing UBX domain for GLUT4
MNRELGTFVDLQKTIAQIGVTSGNILLRLMFKTTETPLEDAMQDISKYFKPDTSPRPLTGAASSVPAETKSENINPEPSSHAVDTVMADAPSASNPPELHETEPQAETTAATTIQSTSLLDSDPAPDSTSLPQSTNTSLQAEAALGQPAALDSSTKNPSITVYTPPTSNTPLAASQSFNEADYVPTLEHATTHQARLVQESRNRRLASDAELAAKARERQAKQDAVSSVRVRIRLPDQAIIETTFARGACSGKLVYDTVRLQMRHPEARFALRYVDAKGVHVTLPDDAGFDVIVKAGWRGSVFVSMVWDAETSAEQRQTKQLSVDLSSAQSGEEKKSGFLGGLFKKDGKEKSKMGAGEKEARLQKLLGFKKK